ncbi:helix-turn-helix domain-containing protein [Fodinicurvata sediminis]|uniref:helix-turn-helix domain-containing protein n=1 Tax=Fodinicurvata sediminis TaxID=1121832 RepID=UPI0003B3C753|nr:helix-turn-helix domain-containing protein [Fodinicurvata sediminis]
MSLTDMKNNAANDRGAGPAFLTTAELAERWKANANTLRHWRMKKIGPPFFKPAGENGRVLYRLDDILAWENAHKTVCGSESSAADG